MEALCREAGKLVIKPIPGKGRGAVARTALAQGTAILQTTPLAAHLEGAVQKGACLHCYAPQSCRRRGGRLCQGAPTSQAYWDRLKVAAKRWHTVPLKQGPSQRSVLAFVAAKVILRMDSQAGQDAHMQAFSDLVYPDLGERIPPEWVESSQLVRKSLLDWGLLSPASAEMISPEFFAGILGRIHINAIRVSSRGSAIFALPSMLNHSCNPNVAVGLNGSRITLTAARDIEEGAECMISYDNAEDYADHDERVKSLEWAYGFQCLDTCTCWCKEVS
ncbi:unnamed protein product [Chrysoparadoxa australica]